MMRRVLLVVGVLCCATSASAQLSWVTLPNGGRVPCDHPLAVSAGLGCTAAPACVTFGTATVCAPCVGVDPYAEPDRAMACVRYHVARAPRVDRPPTVFVAGQVYQGPYPGQRFLVLATALALDGEVVVTVEWTGDGWPSTPRHTVQAFRAKDIDHLFEVAR